MRRLSIVLILLMIPPSAFADSGGSLSMLSAFLQMGASLAIVIGAILLVSRFSNKFIRQCEAAKQRHIRVVETRYLAPKKSLLLVEVGGEYLLLGSSGDGLQMLKEVKGIEEKKGEAETGLAVPFQEKLMAFSRTMSQSSISPPPLLVGAMSKGIAAIKKSGEIWTGLTVRQEAEPRRKSKRQRRR